MASYLALPAMSADLALTPSQQLWAMDVYGFMIAGFLVTMGTRATASAGAGC